MAAEAAVETKPIMQTSLASRSTGEGEVTVQFTRWTAHGQTAYQKGQYAGFPIPIAQRLRDAGRVILDPSFDRAPSNRMVRK